MAQEVMNPYLLLFDIPLSYPQEGLCAVRFSIESYDDPTLKGVPQRLEDGLSTEARRLGRDCEERTKSCDTPPQQLDRRTTAGP
jgi:hypothetical protein